MQRHFYSFYISKFWPNVWTILILGILLLGRANADPNGAANEALSLYNAGKHAESEKLFLELATQEPENSIYWFNLGNALFLQQKYQPAIERWTKTIQLKSKLGEIAHLRIAKAQGLLGRWELAWKELTALQTEAVSPGTKYELKELILETENGTLQAAMEKYREGRLEDARTLFSIVAALRPSADVNQMIGIISFRLRQRRKASEAFQQVLAADHSDFSEDARYFLKRIHDGFGAGRLDGWMTLDLAGGYNSNVNAEGATGLGRVNGEVTLSGGHRFTHSRTIALELSGLVSWDEYQNYSPGRLVNCLGLASAVLNDGKFLGKGGLLFQYQIQGTAPFVLKVGPHLSAQIDLEDLEAGIRAQVTSNYSQNQATAYTKGYSTLAKLFVGKYLPTAYLSAYLVFSQDDIGDLTLPGGIGLIPLANTTFGPGVSLSWFPIVKWQIIASLSYQLAAFRQSALPSLTRRSDNVSEAFFKVWYHIAPSLRLFGSFDAIFSGSTLQAPRDPVDKNFVQLTSLVGVSWNVFD